jgi:signal transduction histidine kinase
MTTELERHLSRLSRGDHVCLIYEDASEQLAAVAPFIKAGLDSNERCLFILDDSIVAEVVRVLEAVRVDVEKACQRGALQFLSARDLYLTPGEFETQTMLEFVHRAEEEALAAGFAGLRLAGDVTWLTEPDTDCQPLIRYEAKLNSLVQNRHSLILCFYQHSRFNGQCLQDLLGTHPAVIVDDQVCANPHYEPPPLVADAPAEDRPALVTQRVDRWLEQLKRAKLADVALQRHTAQLHSLVAISLKIHAARTAYDVAQVVTDEARHLLGCHEAVTGFLTGPGYARTIQAVSLSDKYAAYRSYDKQPEGTGIVTVVCETNRPMRLTQAEVEAHPRWTEFGEERGKHPPLRGWLAAPLVARGGRNIGVVQLSDKYEGEFTAEDEAICVELAQVASVAIENVWLYQQVSAAREKLQGLSRQLLEVQEAERRHLARELHDEIGQLLSTVNLNLQALKGSCDPGGRPRLEENIRIVENVLQQVRNLALDLRPSMLDDLGLVATLRWYADRRAHQAGFTLHFAAASSGTRLPPDLETVCYRVAQEALTNVARHAKARRVWVEFHQDEQEVRLQVRDDGVGFDRAAVRRRAEQGASLGLAGMQERVELMGGLIHVESSPGRGTTIRVRFPVNPANVFPDRAIGGGEDEADPGLAGRRP